MANRSRAESPRQRGLGLHSYCQRPIATICVAEQKSPRPRKETPNGDVHAYRLLALTLPTARLSFVYRFYLSPTSVIDLLTTADLRIYYLRQYVYKDKQIVMRVRDSFQRHGTSSKPLAAREKLPLPARAEVRTRGSYRQPHVSAVISGISKIEATVGRNRVIVRASGGEPCSFVD